MNGKHSSIKSEKNSEKKSVKTHKIPVYLSNIGGRIIVDRYVEVKNPHNIFEAKQSLWDWWEQYNKETPHNYCFCFLNCNDGWIDIQYEDGFKWRLYQDQFPNRNLIPCYEKARGQYLIHHYEEGQDPLPPLNSQKKESPVPIIASNLLEGMTA